MAGGWNFPKYSPDWPQISAAVKRRDNYTCRDCGVKLQPQYLHAHHIVSLSKGGTDDLSNLKTVCEKCHAKYHPHMRPPGERPSPPPKATKARGKSGMFCPPADPPAAWSFPDRPGVAKGGHPSTVVGGRTGCLLFLGPACAAVAALARLLLV